MILNNEQLKQEAHHLALNHDPYIIRKPSKRFWRDAESHIGSLRAFIGQLHRDRSACAQSAEEWLLDHAEFIEEQIITAKHELSEKWINRMPHLKKTGESRVYSICAHYIEHTDGNLKEDSFLSFIRSYQEVSVLSIAEVWAIPMILRIAFIRRLAEMMKTVRERREVCNLVERVLGRMGPSQLTPDKLKEALEQEGQDLPLSGSLIVHLVKHLRERAEDTGVVGEWLICKLENGPESLDPVLSYEYQLQAAYEVSVSNLIFSLRGLSRWDWNETFEQISTVEQTLRGECTGEYGKLDFSSRATLRKRVEQLARRLRLPENLVASQAVELAAAAREKERSNGGGRDGLRPRQIFAAYYLLEPDGIRGLREALKVCGKPRPMPETGVLRRATGAYFNLLAVFFAVAWIGFAVWIGWPASFSPWAWAALLPALLFPAAEWAVTAAHWLIERVRQTVPLLRYDFSKRVPPEAATLVVIPVIWSRVEDVEELTDRLELHYLANRDSNIHFALLGDLTDADREKLPQDAGLSAAAVERIERLNRTYPESPFHLFQRKRQWNPSEGVWMGWERKRGKLVEFVELLKGCATTSYDVIQGDASFLRRVRYIITLDADTQLPLESAQRMIATLHLPYNRPRLNEARTRVVEGYGVLQPRIGMTHEAASKSRVAALWAGDPGIDPYAYAVSDPYQDGLGEGIFTGKGIFDVDAFYEVLCDRIPENRVLSHDLLEGGFLRAGLLSDIELVDHHPARFSMHQKRQHRWVRGDWQLLLWLLPKVRNRRGKLLPVDLSVLTRWQIVDNLRRSLLPPALFAIFLLAPIALPGPSARWFALALATLFLPVFRHIAAVHTFLRNPKGLTATAGQTLIAVLTLPFQTVLFLDAACRTLCRLLWTKRRLLEWVSSAEAERRSRRSGAPSLLGLPGGYALTALFAAAAIWSGSAAVQAMGIGLGVLWACAPFVIRWLDQPLRQEVPVFSEEETAELRSLSGQIWSFYEDYVTEADHWLPPDNVQLEPSNGVAHRTSPTNIGLYLSCVLAARDFQFIDTPGMIQRMERTMDTLDRLDKWEGHLYNWYDTATLEPLPPLYVSTVDSGNFVGCLMTVREGLKEWLGAREMTGGGQDLQHSAGRAVAAFDVAFSEEITMGEAGNWAARGRRLVARLKKWIDDTNFRPLYDHRSRLFSLGYHTKLDKRDEILYDLMASEARQTSFIAIALGQVSVSHWRALGRTMTRAGKRLALLSWSGTMFEYLMPWLYMRTYRNTIWDMTYRAVVGRQIEYARQRQVPFGISESGYYAFDYKMNYQYRAFGVPGLGFKRGLENDLVVTPYATILALHLAREEGLQALRQFERLGGRGKYGYYEAIDFTRERLPENRGHMVIRSFMAHHQGMSMLALSNLLLPQKMYERFHRNKEVRAAELLLQERVPKKPKLIKHPAMHRVHLPYASPAQDAAALRQYPHAHTETPEVCILSNGVFAAAVTNSGSGWSRYGGLAVSRWREDPVADPWGSYAYIRDVTRNKVWSPTYQPCRVEPEEQRIQFSLGRAMFERLDDGVRTRLEICVSPEYNAEVRRLTLTNGTKESKVLEVATFVELAMIDSLADEAHPAFSKLFIQTEYDEKSGCLTAVRRARDRKDVPLWAAHSLIAEGHPPGNVEYETDRAVFIGRGRRLSEPRGICARMRGTTGSVADPAFAMKRRVVMEPGEQKQLYIITAAAETKQAAVDTVLGLVSDQAVERAFQMAWNHGQIELRYLRLSNREAADFQTYAGRVLYTPPLSKARASRIPANTKGQSGLWAFGLSGDRPIIVVRIHDLDHMKFVVKLLTGHEYLRRLGLLFDLVLLNESEGGYYQNLQELLHRAVGQEVDRFDKGMAGIYVIADNQLAEEDRTLLMAAARVVLRADGPSLAAQLRFSPRQNRTAWPEAGGGSEKSAPGLRGFAIAMDGMETPAWAKPVCVGDASAQSGREDAGGEATPIWTESARTDDSSERTGREKTKDWLFFNGWGGFSPDGKQYRILIKDGNYLPAPWINVLANPQFGCLVSELGTGYTWWRNSRECKLTPWSNDPVLDPPSEIAYLRDEENGRVWSAAPSAARIQPPYEIAHGWGFTRFDHERHGIRHEMTVFVPLRDPVKVMRLKLRNGSPQRRQLSLTYYAEWVLGVQRSPAAPYIVTEWLESANVLTACNKYQENFREATAFLGIFPPPDRNGDDSQGLSWTADRSEFIGRNGNAEDPAAMERAGLSGRTGAMYDPCGAVRAQISLEPGEEKTVYILLGCEQSTEAVTDLARRYGQPETCEQALREVQDFWEHTLSQTTVSTPSPETDVLLNGWLLYQSLACRMWARSAFYQAGGAYGFRDQLQDSLALLHTLPDLTRNQILLHASHQYEEGDVQHWWHEEIGRGIRTLFSDDLLWLPYTISRYIEHTGDWTILDETVPFLYSEPLRENEHERYEPVRQSAESATIYDHGLRAIDKALRRMGEHGLPLIGVGDWNDGMNLIGAEGRGESVWLGWFMCEVLERFADICRRREDTGKEEHFRAMRGKLADSINRHAWDGQWYRRAFTDSGAWLGSVHSEECRIDAIAQSWSVLSGAAPKERMVEAMQSFERELVDRELSVIRLLTPAFDSTEPNPGYIQGYPPGIRENGAQYTHGAIWSVAAWCKLGKGDKAFELFRMLNPVTHTRTDREVRQYAGEPYVMAADVYTAEAREGHAGWTWYTGAASWMYQTGIESILGIRRRADRLCIYPCIPSHWPEFTATYRFGQTRYVIHVANPSGKSTGISQGKMDGKEILMGEPGRGQEGVCIALCDDGRDHRLELTL